MDVYLTNCVGPLKSLSSIKTYCPKKLGTHFNIIAGRYCVTKIVIIPDRLVVFFSSKNPYLNILCCLSRPLCVLTFSPVPILYAHTHR